MKYAIIPVILLAGCTTVSSPPEPAGPCRVDDAAVRRFVGTKFRMRDRQEIQALTNAPVARVLRPGDMATMDYRQDRLNIKLDEYGRINELRCG